MDIECSTAFPSIPHSNIRQFIPLPLPSICPFTTSSTKPWTEISLFSLSSSLRCTLQLLFSRLPSHFIHTLPDLTVFCVLCRLFHFSGNLLLSPICVGLTYVPPLFTSLHVSSTISVKKDPEWKHHLSAPFSVPETPCVSFAHNVCVRGSHAVHHGRQRAGHWFPTGISELRPQLHRNIWKGVRIVARTTRTHTRFARAKWMGLAESTVKEWAFHVRDPSSHEVQYWTVFLSLLSVFVTMQSKCDEVRGL